MKFLEKTNLQHYTKRFWEPMREVNHPDFLLSVIQSAPVGLVALDEQGRIALLNQRGAMNLNLEQPLESYAQCSVFSLLDEAPEFQQYIREFLDGLRQPFDLLELAFQDKYLTVRGQYLEDVLLLSITDVSELKKMERSAVQAMLDGQENERRRLARDLHDGIGPLLSTLKMYIEHLEPAVQSGSAPDYRSIVSLTNTLTQEVRNISHALMPNAVEDFGLAAALQNLCEQAEAGGKSTVQFFSLGMQQRLEPVTELALYRIGQELLNNAIKHAKAKHISLQIIRHRNSVVLMVEDDGQGFDALALDRAQSGIGLQNIETRVRSLNGTFALDTQPGRGVTATVEIPL